MLLDTKIFKPYKNGKKYLTQDEIVLHYNYWTNDWDLFVNGEVISGENEYTLFEQFKNLLKDLKENETVVCFVNDLKLAMAMFPGGEISGYKKDASNTEHPIYYTTNHIQFRNFSLFHISAKGEGAKNVGQMYDYLISLAKMFGRTTINACQYTIGWVSERALAYGLDEKILDWNAKNHNFVDSIQEYEDQLIGCKSGLLKAQKGIHDDVLMIDLKSAYISAFLQYDKFPIGRDRMHTQERAVVNFLQGECYHIVIECDDIYPEFRAWKQGNCYGFYDLDVEFFNLQKIDVKKWILDRLDEGCNIRAYSNQNYGRLMKEVCDKFVEFRTLKEQTVGENKEAIKAITEMFYGKALQEREFENKKECYHHFLRPEHYMRPKYSMIASAYIRLRMLKMIQKLGGSYYHDTDGIETSYSKESLDYVKEENKRIIELNRSLGYETNLGTWEIEARHARILIIGRKQRMFEDDHGHLGIKIAGLPKKYVEQYIHQNRPMDVFEHFSKKVEIPMPGPFGHDEFYGFYCDEIKMFTLGKDD